MYGLWDAEVVEGVTNRSALLTMPFSGWGSVRGRAGMAGGNSADLYFLSLSRQMASIAARASWRTQHRNCGCGRMCVAFANAILR